MDGIERIQYKGFTFSSDGKELGPGQWECHLLVEKQGYLAEQFQILPLQSTAIAAIELAFSSGRRMADGMQFSLALVGATPLQTK